jgi:hypothetical protein
MNANAKYTFGNPVSEHGVMFVTPYRLDDVSHLGYYFLTAGRDAVIFRQI